MPATSTINEAQARLQDLYSGVAFQKAAQQWTNTLAGHFRALNVGQGPVLNWEAPVENIKRATSQLHGDKPAAERVDEWVTRFTGLLELSLSQGHNLHHPRYLGHQVPAAVPIAALFDALGMVTNQVMAIYEMGPWATAVERAMLSALGAEIGYAPDSFDGLVTGGGSLANLTALLTARNVALATAWRGGIQESQNLALVVQADVHYSVTRAAGILGIGTEQVIRVPVDDQRRMKTDCLADTLERLRLANRQVIAVVAGACATPTGAFDPLEEIADVCEAAEVWFHVDAAHGGAALLSDQHRHLLTGIERADSVVWDAHKMLFVPAACAFAFYKDKQHSLAAFEQDATYLFDPTNIENADYDNGRQTLECTKRAATYGLWGIWSLFGRQLFTDLVDVTFGMTRILHQQLEEAVDFQPLHEPQCNIQAFRYLPRAVRGWSPEEVGAFQYCVRRRLIESGLGYIASVQFDGVGALRSTVINPCTTAEDICALLDYIRECGAACLDEAR